MNWVQIQSNWGLFRRRIKQRWHRLTDEQLNAIAGQRARLVRSIGDMYQLSAHESERQLSDWQAHQRMAAAE
jgi:hypothetical protein